MGNPAPVLRDARRAPRVAAARRGQDGLKLRIDTDGGAPLEAIGWSLGAAHRGARRRRSPIDIAYRLERDEYQGVSRLQARLADFRA